MQRDIYEFAVRWQKVFTQTQQDCRRLYDPAFRTECEQLGFRCDQESLLTERYGRDWTDPRVLQPQLTGERNLFLLGTALFTRWHYFDFQANDGREILRPDSLRWMTLVLERIAVLATESQGLFRGTLQQLQLVSNRMVYGLTPDPWTVAQQSLSIGREGQVVLTSTGFGTAEGPGPQLWHLEEQIPDFQGALIADAVGEYFSQNVPTEPGPDQGDWELTLINTQGKQFVFRGGLGDRLQCGNAELSELMCSCLDMDDLLAFAGDRDQPEQIRSVWVRVLQQRGDFRENREEPLIRETAEYMLGLDRQEESLTLTERRFDGCTASHIFCLGGAVSALLDSQDPLTLLAEKPEQPEDLIGDPEERWIYEIRVTLRHGEQRSLTGSFDRYGLPRDYGDFAAQTDLLLRDFSGSLLLKPAFYGRDRQRRSGTAVCSVEFPGSSHLYDYLTVQSCYRVGDWVQVPAGFANRTAVAVIRKIRYVPAGQAQNPEYPLKYILGKAEEPKE